MITLATIVAWGELIQSVAAGAVAAILLTLIVSFGIRGAAKYIDYHQDGRNGLAYASLAMGGISAVLTAGLIVVGIYLMLNG